MYLLQFYTLLNYETLNISQHSTITSRVINVAIDMKPFGENSYIMTEMNQILITIMISLYVVMSE